MATHVCLIPILHDAFSITTQPSDYTGYVGEKATFSVTAQGIGLTYQWQCYSNGAWINSGVTGAKPCPKRMKFSYHIEKNRTGLQKYEKNEQVERNVRLI